MRLKENVPSQCQLQHKMWKNCLHTSGLGPKHAPYPVLPNNWNQYPLFFFLFLISLLKLWKPRILWHTKGYINRQTGMLLHYNTNHFKKFWKKKKKVFIKSWMRAYLAIVHIIQKWRNVWIAELFTTFNWRRFLKANNVSIFKLCTNATSKSKH